MGYCAACNSKIFKLIPYYEQNIIHFTNVESEEFYFFVKNIKLIKNLMAATHRLIIGPVQHNPGH